MQAADLEQGMTIKSEESGWMKIQEIAKGSKTVSLYVGDTAPEKVGITVPATMHFQVKD